MASKLNTGGVIKGSGGMEWGGKSCDTAAASVGTTVNNPNVKDDAKPGGHGSSGSPSSSKAK
jgi:hypothetical protein